MPVTAASRRYAQAVFDMGKEQGTLATWNLDLGIIRETLLSDPQVMTILASPDVSLVEKRRFTDQMFAGDISQLARNLVELLLGRGRVGILPDVQEAFDELYLAEQGIAFADVTTAVPLDPAEELHIVEMLTKMTGKTIKIRTHVDPEILGGVKAQVGDQLIDGTVKTRLEQLRSRLKAAV